MKKSFRRPLRGLFSATAVLSLATAGLAVGFAPAAQAAEPSPYTGPVFQQSLSLTGMSANHYEYDYNADRTALIRQDYSNYSMLSMNTSFQASNRSIFANLSGRSVYGSETRGSTRTNTPFANSPSAVGTDSRYNQANGSQKYTGGSTVNGAGGTSDDGRIVVGASTFSGTVADINPYQCASPDAPIVTENVTVGPSRLSPDFSYSDPDPVGIESLTDSTVTTTSTLASIDDDDPRDLRKTVVEANSGTGTYLIYDGRVKVEVVSAATLRHEVDGADTANPVYAFAPAVVKVTGLNGVTRTLEMGGTRYYSETGTDGTRVSVDLGQGIQNVSAADSWMTGAIRSNASGQAFTWQVVYPTGDPLKFVSDSGQVGSMSTYTLTKGAIDCTRPVDADTDGLYDFEEVETHKTDYMVADTDTDGLTDGAEVSTHKTSPLLADTDKDGLSDGEEVTGGVTNPKVADTDGDGLNDGGEKTAGSDPLVKDTDKDGLLDGAEVNSYKTDPTKADTDGDTLTDYYEVIQWSTLR